MISLGPFTLTPGTPFQILSPVRHPDRPWMVTITNLSPYSLAVEAGITAYVAPWQRQTVRSAAGVANLTVSPSLVAAAPPAGVTTSMLLGFYGADEAAAPAKLLVMGLTPPVVVLA